MQTGDPLVKFGAASEPADGIRPSGAGAGASVRWWRSDTVLREQTSAVGPHPGGLKATPAVRALAHRLDVDLAIVTPSGIQTITTADVQRVAKILAEVEPVEPFAECAAPWPAPWPGARGGGAGNDLRGRRYPRLAAGQRCDATLDPCAGRRLRRSIAMNVVRRARAVRRVFIEKDRATGTPWTPRVFLRAGIARCRRSFPTTCAEDSMRCARRCASDHPSRRASRVHDYTVELRDLRGPLCQPHYRAADGGGASIRHSHQLLVAWNGQPAVHTVIPLSLTFDHRAATGGGAARFMR